MAPVDPDLEVSIRGVLGDVMDPCSQSVGVPMSLAEMGLVENIAFEGPGRVVVTLRVTAPQCLFAPLFATEVEDRVSALPGVSSALVRISDKLTWTEEDIDPAARVRLQRRRSAGEAAPAGLSGQTSSVRASR